MPDGPDDSKFSVKKPPQVNLKGLLLPWLSENYQWR